MWEIWVREAKICNFMHLESNMRKYARSSWAHTRNIMNNKDIIDIFEHN